MIYCLQIKVARRTKECLQTTVWKVKMRENDAKSFMRQMNLNSASELVSSKWEPWIEHCWTFITAINWACQFQFAKVKETVVWMLLMAMRGRQWSVVSADVNIPHFTWKLWSLLQLLSTGNSFYFLLCYSTNPQFQRAKSQGKFYQFSFLSKFTFALASHFCLNFKLHHALFSWHWCSTGVLWLSLFA